MPANMYKYSSIFTGRFKVVLLLLVLFQGGASNVDPFYAICVCDCYTVLSVPCSLVVTSGEGLNS